MLHVYPRADMEGVHAGTVHPGDALDQAAAVHAAAVWSGRNAHDIARFVSPVVRGRKSRVYIAARRGYTPLIIAAESDPARQPPAILATLPHDFGDPEDKW